MSFGSVEISPSQLPQVMKRVAEMTNKRVMVGIPSSATERNDGAEINNATIGYINEFGEPDKNIPPRPHLVPGIISVQEKAIDILRDAGKSALTSDYSNLDTALEKVGLLASTAVKTRIMAGLTPPLSPRTIEARRKGSENRSGDLPLIDTGNYLQHITYVVRDKRNNNADT